MCLPDCGTAGEMLFQGSQLSSPLWTVRVVGAEAAVHGLRLGLESVNSSPTLLLQLSLKFMVHSST